MQPLIASRRHVADPGMRRDPAPSKWSYRMQRFWLTPTYREAVRIGLPVVLVSGAIALFFASDDRRQLVTDAIGEVRERFETRPEFMVSLVSIEGASPELADAVRARLELDLPLSSFQIDLGQAQERVQELDAVARADLMVRSGGVLEVNITERVPVVLWRTDFGLEMLDATGHRVASLAARTDRPDLPLIAGDGADGATAEALALFAAAGPLQPRVRGFVRIGERRWDMVLDRNQRVLLPHDKPIAAIERLIALDKAHDLMGRDILSVDLRNEHRPVLRLTPYALAQRRKAQGFDITGSEL